MKRRGTLDEADYLVGPQKSVHRRRADPRVSMASLLMEILNELKNLEGSEHFAYPVNIKKVLAHFLRIQERFILGSRLFEYRQKTDGLATNPQKCN